MFNRRGRTRNCEHPRTTTTANYGLTRTVCRDCGMVHLEDMGTAVTTEPKFSEPEMVEVVLEAPENQSVTAAG